jgi:hypothetical protein
MVATSEEAVKWNKQYEEFGEKHEDDFAFDDNKSCSNCKHFEPAEDIQCEVFAKIHKWDRPNLEIDCPETFKCGGHKNG